MLLIRVSVEICGDPVTGLWCEHCNLSTGVEVVILVGNVPKSFRRCLECTDTLERS
jgi:hypothetical protein